jgi:hypothetical protein
LVRKLAPIVDLVFMVNFLSTYRSSSEVLPTPDSPSTIIFNRIFFFDMSMFLLLMDGDASGADVPETRR